MTTTTNDTLTLTLPVTNKYGNTDGIPKDYVVIPFFFAANFLESLKPNLKNYVTQSCTGFAKGGYRNSWVPNIDDTCHILILEELTKKFKAWGKKLKKLEEKAKEEKEAKEAKEEFVRIEKEKAIKAKLTDVAYIAGAIYSISKEAKRQRDIASRAYASTQDDCEDDCEDGYGQNPKLLWARIKKANLEKSRIYQIKDTALNKLIKITNAQAEGFHVFDDGKRRDFYKFQSFSFHVNQNTSSQELGAIDEEISSSRARSMPPAKAEQVIQLFINS